MTKNQLISLLVVISFLGSVAATWNKMSMLLFLYQNPFTDREILSDPIFWWMGLYASVALVLASILLHKLNGVRR